MNVQFDAAEQLFAAGQELARLTTRVNRLAGRLVGEAPTLMLPAVDDEPEPEPEPQRGRLLTTTSAFVGTCFVLTVGVLGFICTI